MAAEILSGPFGPCRAIGEISSAYRLRISLQCTGNNLLPPESKSLSWKQNVPVISAALCRFENE